MYEHLTDAQRAEIRAIVREEIAAASSAATVINVVADGLDSADIARVVARAERRKALAAQMSRVTDWPPKNADDQPVREAIAEMLDWLGANILGVSGLGKLYAEHWQAPAFDTAEYANEFWKRLQLRVGNDGLPSEGDDLVLKAADEQHEAVQKRGADEGGRSPGVDHVGHVVAQSGGDVGSGGQLQVSESGERAGLCHESSPSVGCGNATVGEPTAAGGSSGGSPAADRAQQ